jgi:hypothetical protein
MLASEAFVQQGFCDSWASVLNSTFVLIFGIDAELGICAFNSPPSQSPKTLAATL